MSVKPSGALPSDSQHLTTSNGPQQKLGLFRALACCEAKRERRELNEICRFAGREDKEIPRGWD